MPLLVTCHQLPTFAARFVQDIDLTAAARRVIQIEPEILPLAD